MIGSFVFSACSNEQITANNEEQLIATFYHNTIADTTGKINVIDSVISDGIIKLSITAGNDSSIEQGDSVYFYYIGRVLNSSNISEIWDTTNVFATNIDSVAIKCGLAGMIGQSEEQGIAGKNHYIKGLDIGLTMMNEQEEAFLLFPSKLAYGNNLVGTIPANSPLIFQIKITKIKKN